MRKTYILLTGLIFAGGLYHANAQSGNRSDFNVPPPLAPGSTTKGNTAGKTTAGKPVILTLSNIPAFGMPTASSLQLPELAAIGTSAPLTNQPEQPTLMDIISGLPEIPLPVSPEAPNLPKQTLQDTPLPWALDLPIPDAPDMPDFPKEPVSRGRDTQKGLIPVMPDVLGAFGFSIPYKEVFMTWSTPGIPENVEFKLLLPENGKAVRPRIQGKKKVTGGTSGRQ